MFILEDFLDKRDSRKALFDQGNAILDQLVNVSLLERVSRDHVKMHDLVRAMALKITEGTTKVIAGNRSLTEIPNDREWTNELEKMSLMMNGIRTIPDGMSPECPKLSVLILCSDGLNFSLRKGNYILDFIPKSFFLRMCNLSILDLSFTGIKQLPDEVSDMESLKALILRSCDRLSYVPCLGKLKKLRKLVLSNTALEEVPQGMEKLNYLQFLALDEISKLKMLPINFLLNFRCLQCLFLPNHIHIKVEELVELKYLEEFHGRVEDFKEFFQMIRRKQNLHYKIVVQKLDNDSDVISFPRNRGYNALGLMGYDLKELLDEDVDVLELGILCHIWLKECEGWSSKSLVEDLGRLINSTFLESLSVRYCEGIESILRNSATMSPLIVQSSVFTSLTQLFIWGCNNIKILGISVSQLPNLIDIIIQRCSDIEEIFEAESGREQSGHIQALSFPSKLRRVCLCELPNLKSICNVTIVCASLYHMQMWGCKSLKKFPLVFGQPNSDSPPLHLWQIDLKEREKGWWMKMELGDPTHHTLLQPFIHWDI